MRYLRVQFRDESFANLSAGEGFVRRVDALADERSVFASEEVD